MHILPTVILPIFLTLLHHPNQAHAHNHHDHDRDHEQAHSASTPPLSTTPLTPEFFPNHHSQRVKLTYGPYPVPSMHVDNGMVSFGGTTIPPPCTSCVVTFMHAGLEYTNGSTADARTGMWLHHTVWTNLARRDAACPAKKHGDRFFASGNERTPVDLTARGTVQAGYPIRKGDVLAMGGELMNMRHEAAEVVLSVVFEFIPAVPKGFREVSGYWLDVGGCHGSEVPAFEGERFQYVSPAVVAGEEGEVVFTASHLHDGGVNSEIRRNGVLVCDSVATYGGGEESHIEALSTCSDIGWTKKGDEWSVTSFYDTTKHAPMRNMDGTLEPVMGISLVYVALGKEKHGHKTLKMCLGLAIFTLSLVLVVMWARLNGRDWLGRKKVGVQLGEGDGKRGSWMSVGRYRDEE